MKFFIRDGFTFELEWATPELNQDMSISVDGSPLALIKACAVSSNHVISRHKKCSKARFKKLIGDLKGVFVPLKRQVTGSHTWVTRWFVYNLIAQRASKELGQNVECQYKGVGIKLPTNPQLPDSPRFVIDVTNL